jgi:Spy/CpxP family protein refolding chaperone
LFGEIMKFVKFSQQSLADQKNRSPSCFGEVPEEINLTREQKQALQKIIDDQLMKMWYKANRYQLSDEMKSFALLVGKTGKDFNLLPLQEYSERFIQALDSFELDKMESCLSSFPQFIGKIKNATFET